MSVNPLDLQVLFSKASDYAASLGKQSTVNDAEDYVANDKQTHLSQTVDEEVSKTDAYDEEFTNIDENTKGRSYNSGSKGKGEHEEPEEHKRGLTEEGNGLIIDIID